MTLKPFTVCAKHSCQELTKERYCDIHIDEHKQQVSSRRRAHDARRGTSTSRGYSYKWRKARLAFLKGNRFCIKCIADSSLHMLAEVVDHIIPHKGDDHLFWDRSNWQPLCKRCHDIKTAREDGGFGRNNNQGGVSRLFSEHL